MREARRVRDQMQETRDTRNEDMIGSMRTFHVCFLYGLTLAALCVGPACESNTNKKSSLTEQEIRRLTYAPQPARPDELIVSGVAVTCEDVMASEQRDTSPSLREALIALAKQTTLEQFLEMARPQVRQRLNRNITDAVLYRRARTQLGDRAEENLDKMAEKELRKFIVEHGGNGAAADAALQEQGMNRARYKESKKRQMLGQYYVMSKLSYNRPITHGELLDVYEAMKDESFARSALVQLRLIDIDISKVTLSDADDDPLATARAMAKDLIERIRAGADFAELAKEYSHGYRAPLGGLWPPRNPASLAEPYDVLAEEAKQVHQGDVAGPIETLGHIFIMKLEQKQEQGYLPLSEVQAAVESRIRQVRQREVLTQLDAEVAQQVALADTDCFLDYCLESLYRLAQEPTQTP